MLLKVINLINLECKRPETIMCTDSKGGPVIMANENTIGIYTRTLVFVLIFICSFLFFK